MNKRIHRLVFDRKRGMRVPAAEHVRGAGKQAGGQARAVAVAVASLLAVLQSDVADAAQPLRPVVGTAANAWNGRTNNMAGAAGNLPQRSVARWNENYGKPVTLTLKDGDTTLNINQEDRRVILNWDTFNIGQGYSVHFQQPVGGSALNKIWDTKENPTVILGKLTATGEVILENTNGVFFGSTARVEAGRFVATALSLSKETYLKGIRAETDGYKAVFGSDADKAKGFVSLEAGAEVKALAGGDVMMIAPKVINDGNINASGGQVILAAGQKVYLYSSSDPAQRGLLVSVDGFVPPVAPPEATEQPAPLPAGTNAIENNGSIRSEKGSINVVGMSIRQNGVLTATTAVKGENGAIYLQAAKTNAAKADAATGHSTPSPAELGSIELTESSKTVVELDTSGATQKDAETFYRSNIQVLAKDIRVRSGAVIEAKGGNIDLLATSNNQPGGGSLSALDDVDGSFAKDDATLVVEHGAHIDASGVKDVQLDMSRNQMSGQFFKIELADSPVQRGGVLYRQKVQFDGRNAVTVGNTKGFYNSVERTAQELSTKGGNVRLQSTGSTVLADGAEVDISGGTLHYQAGTISTSLLRRGDRLVALNNASASVKYDALLSSKQTLAVDGYLQGADAGSLSIAGAQRAYAGLSAVKAGVEVGPYQRAGQVASTDPKDYKEEDRAPARKTRSRSLYSAQYLPLAAQPNLYASLRPQAGLIAVGLDYAKAASQFMAEIRLVKERQAGVTSVPEAHTMAGDAFFDSLPEGTQVSAAEVMKSKASQLTLMADKVTVASDVALDLGASGVFKASSTQDLIVAGSVRAAGGKATLLSSMGDVHLTSGSSIDVSGMEIDERGRNSGEQALSVKGGGVVIQAGQSAVLDAGSTVDVSAGVWRDGKGGVTKGSAGSISVSINNADLTTSVPTEGGGTRLVYERQGRMSLQGELAGYDFASGGTLTLSGMRTLTIGQGAEAVDGGLALDPRFFSEHGFGSFELKALGDVVVNAGTPLTPTLQNLVFKTAARSAAADGFVGKKTLDAGLRKGIKLSLQSTSTPVETKVGATDVPILGLENGGSLTIGQDATVDVGAGGSIALTAGRNLTVAGTLRAQGGAIDLSILGPRGSDVTLATESKDSAGYLSDQYLYLTDHARLDVSGIAKVFKDASGRQAGEILGGGTINLNYDTANAVRGRLLADAGSVMDVSGASGDLSLSRGNGLNHVSKGAGTINVGSTDGFVLLSELKADRPDDSVSGGTFNANVSRAGLGDVIKGGVPYEATERAIVLKASAVQVAEYGRDHLGQGVLAADSLNNAGFANIQLRADDRVVLAEGANLIGRDGGLRSATINTRSLEAEGSGHHVIQAQYVAVGDKDLSLQRGESATSRTKPVGASGDASLAVQAGLIEVYGNSALRGFKQTDLAATLDAKGGNNRTDGEVRWIGRPATIASGAVMDGGQAIEGQLSFGGTLNVTAGQTYATTLSDFAVQGVLGASSLNVFTPQGGSSSKTPLSAWAHLSLGAQNLFIDGVIRQPFGRITVNGEETPQLGARSLLSVSGDGVKVPVGSTINQTQWLYMADGSTVVIDPRAVAAISLDGRVLSKGILVKGKSLVIDGQSQMQAQAGGDLIAWEFIPGTGGSSDTLNRANVFAILPGYTYDFAPYDTEIANATAKAGNKLAVGDQVVISSSNDVLQAGKYTLLPARYAVLAGAVLVSEATVKSGGNLAQGLVADDGSVTVSGYKTAAGTSINGGQDPRLALLLEPESTFRAKSELQITSINDYVMATDEQSTLPGDAGRISLVATDRPFSWAARYNLAGQGSLAGGQLELAMADMVVANAGMEAAKAPNAVTAQALKATGADSILLGGYRESTSEGDKVAQSANTVTVSADVQANEFIAVAKQAVNVGAGVTITSQAASSAKTNNLIIKGTGAALVASNKVNTEVSRELKGADLGSDAAHLTVGDNVTVTASAVQFDSSKGMTLGQNLTAQAQALGLGAKHVAVGGKVKDDQAVVADAALLKGKRSVTLRAYEAVDLVGNVDLSQPGLKQVVLDAPTIRGVGQVGDVAKVAAERVVLRNTSKNEAATTADAGQTQLQIKGAPAVADATAEGITIGEGKLNLAFEQVNLQSTGDVVFRDKGLVSTQGDARIVAARVTADKTADHGIISGQTLTVTHGEAERTLGDRVGAGGKLALEGKRVVQDGLVDVASGRIGIHGTGLAGQANTVELTGRSETKAAGWVAQAGNGWATVAPGGQIKVSADEGNVLVNGTLDVSAPTVTQANGKQVGASAGSIAISATGQAKEGRQSGAVILGADAKLRGSALAAATSGRVAVDARRLEDASKAVSADVTHTALDTLAQLIQAGGFHNEIDVRVREGNQALNSTMEATRVKLSADAGSLTLGSQAVINAQAERGGVVQLAAGKDLVVSSGAQILADSSADPKVGANGGDILLASTDGWVDLQEGSLISAKGDDAQDGRVIVRAKVQTDPQDLGDKPESNRIKVRKVGAVVKAADIQVEGVQTYKTSEGTQTVTVTAKGQLQKVTYVASKTKPGKWDVTTLVGNGTGVTKTAYITDPDTGITTTKVVSSSDFDSGAKISTTVVKGTDKPASTNNTWVTESAASLVVGGRDVFDEASKLVLHQGDIASALALDKIGGKVRAGIEIQSDAAFSLNTDWNLQTIGHFGDQPVNLTLRSKGDLNINGSLSDGFASAKRADAAAKTPVGVLAGPAASYRLVAGADVDAANPLATMGTTDAGSLTIAAGKMVRTTTGSIEMAAAGDVNLAAGSGDTPVQGVVYVAGGASADQAGMKTDGRSAWQQFTAHGGRLDVTAGRDIASPVAAQLFGNWFIQTGQAASTVAWASSFDSFKQGFGSFGGGNVSLSAGQNIVNPGVVAPTSARTVATGEGEQTYSQIIENGGDILVRAEGDVLGGVYFLGRGQGRVEAGGAIGAGGEISYKEEGRKTDSNKDGTVKVKPGAIFGLMDGKWSLQSNGNLAVSAVYNPTMVAFKGARKPSGLTAYDTYSNASALMLSSTNGNVNWTVDGGRGVESVTRQFTELHRRWSASADKVEPALIDIGDRAELMYQPARIVAQALQGDLNLAINAPSGVPVVQKGSSETNLTLYAGENLSLMGAGDSVWTVNNAANEGWTSKTLSKPSTQVNSSSTGALLGLAKINSNQPQDMGVKAGQEPVRIHANGDLAFEGMALNVAKAGLISAGGDIKELAYVGQHQLSTDVTRIVAGGNLTGQLNAPKDRQFGVVQLSGPGELQIEAGKNLNLQNAYGVETVGLTQADGSVGVGASLRIAAGASKTVDTLAFADRYLQDADSQRALIDYVQQTLKLSGLSYDQAWSYFQSLTREHQLAFAEPFVSNAFVKRYVDVASTSDPIWAYVARDNKMVLTNTLTDLESDLYKQYTKAQAALVSYVQGLKGETGLSFEQALTKFRSLTGAEQAGLVDKKKNVSASMLAALMAADTANTYAGLWQERVAQAKAVNPSVATGYDSELFAQFRDDVVMKEFQRLGSAVSNVADSDNPVMNGRRQAVRDEIWRQAREMTEVAGMAAPYQFQGNLNLASSKVHTQGHGDLNQGGIDLFVPGGSVLVGRAAASEFDRGSEEAARRGLIAQDGGSIRSYSAGDFQVNSQKAFVVGEGDLLVYSAEGNIDSGRGSNTDLAVPPLSAQTDPFTGGTRFVTKAPTTGSGIGILKNAEGTSKGKVSLLAPKGEVRALDAFIQGPQIELPGKVVGADNIKGEVKGQAPAPTVSVNLSINTGLGTETASGETKDQIEAKKTQAKARSSLVTVDVLGVGDADAPASGNADDNKKTCKDETNCKR